MRLVTRCASYLTQHLRAPMILEEYRHIVEEQFLVQVLPCGGRLTTQVTFHSFTCHPGGYQFWSWEMT